MTNLTADHPPEALQTALANPKTASDFAPKDDGPKSTVAKAWLAFLKTIEDHQKHCESNWIADDLIRAEGEFEELAADGHHRADDLGLYQAEADILTLLISIREKHDQWWEEEGRYERDDESTWRE